MEINLGGLALDIDFHPSKELVTTGLINGDLHLYSYAANALPQRLLKVRAHSDQSCRAARFIDGGSAIATCSPDRSILTVDVVTGSPKYRLENAHCDPISRLINLDETTIATGDDEGCIKVWDTRNRKRSCCNTFHAHRHYISDITFCSEGSKLKLLATSGDGSLSVYDIRENKVQAQSEFSGHDLLSVVIMKDGHRVVCGSQIETLLLYSWGCFKDCSDRFRLYRNSVGALLKLDEDTIITGSEDGLISLVGMLPNRIIQPIAEH
ncbi:hypothetical protein FH972_006688 [Carpinus fangiana]|uniref:Uncharacterized protein n=1 Tax=Carpinus fangiana TaxID=176857 RepID=A0A5N6QU44_9ROSI|nr:hypothetical protein FH972_006688 [Carpinus fangiana]